jgi:hypothetical protein
MKKIAVFLVAVGCLLGREAFGVTELIGNGGFESPSTVPWQFLGNLVSVPVVANPGQAHGGNNFLSLGNENGVAAQGVFQVVTIPTNTLLAKYTFFWNSSSTDPSGTVLFRPLIVSTNASQTILATLDQQYNNGTNSYQQDL